MSTVIAVDGTAASGKGTLAKRLARRYGFAHLDSGSLYRLVALGVTDAGGDPHSERDALAAARAIDPDAANNARIRSAEIGNAASLVSVFPSVRAALLEYQRNFGAKPAGGAPGAVIDGRDIGTVVFPDAAAKLFVDAAPEVRAHRRWLELRNLRPDAPFLPKVLHPENLPKMPEEAEILVEILARDARDRSRATAPLKPAPDAVLLDTTHLDIDAAFKAALAIVEGKLTAPPQG